MTGLFWKVCGGALITAVLVLTLGKQEKDIALVVGMAGCVLAVTAAYTLLEPVLEFLGELEQLGDLQSGVLGILLKITGIGLTAETTGLILADCGNSSLTRGVQMAASAVMLSLSLPVLETLLDLIRSILGG